jgi:carboxymethylenebutenolidase
VTQSTFLTIAGGKLPAYVAEPATTPHSAIIVIQEIFGVNAGIRRRCDMFAEKGYLAIAPDLFWRIEQGVELDPDIKPQLERGMTLLQSFDVDQGIEDIKAAIDAARHRLGKGTKVGAVGYCAGGRFAFLTAARSDVDASVSYYGFGIENELAEGQGIRAPLMLHYGEEDPLIPPGSVSRVRDGLSSLPHVEIHQYSGAGHGFATEFGERRVEAAARLADSRTAAFFARNLS